MIREKIDVKESLKCNHLWRWRN